MVKKISNQGLIPSQNRESLSPQDGVSSVHQGLQELSSQIDLQQVGKATQNIAVLHSQNISGIPNNQILSGDLKSAILSANIGEMGGASGSWMPQVTPQEMVQSFQEMLGALSNSASPLFSGSSLKGIQSTVKDMDSLVQNNLCGWTPQKAQSTKNLEIPKELSQVMEQLAKLLSRLVGIPLPKAHEISQQPSLPNKTSVAQSQAKSNPVSSPMSSKASHTSASSNEVASTTTPSSSTGAVGSNGEVPNEGVKIAQNMSSAEIQDYRKKIKKGLKNNKKAVELAKDPKAMALCTPEEKAQLIKKLTKGKDKNKMNQAVYDIAASCTSKKEFESVMKEAGGKDVVDDLNLDSAKKRMNMLCGMWGNKEWANNEKQAALAENALLDPKVGASLVGDVDCSNPVGGLNSSALPKDATDSLIAKEGHIRAERSFDIGMEPKAYKELIMTNAQRKADGKEPLDWKKANQDVFQLVEGGNIEVDGIKYDLNKAPKDFKVKELRAMGIQCPLGIKPKKKKIHAKVREKAMEALRNKYGMSEAQMRELFTQRHSVIFKESGKNVKEQGKIIKDQLKDNVKVARQNVHATLQQFGPGSPEAKQAQERLEEAKEEFKTNKKKINGESGRLESLGKSLDKMYGPPLSATEKFLEGLKKFWKVFEVILDIASIVINVIPGVGQAVSLAYNGIKAGVKLIASAAQGDWRGAIGAVVGGAASMVGAGGIVSGAVKTGLNIATKAAQGALAVYDTVKTGNPLALLGAAGSALGNAGSSIGGLTEGVAKGLNTASKVVQTGVAGAGFVQGAATGNWSSALGSLGGVAGGISSLSGNNPQISNVMNQVQKGLNIGAAGAGFVQGAATGNWDMALGSATQVLGQVGELTNDKTKNILGHVQKGVGAIHGLATGNYAYAADQFNQSISPLMSMDPNAKKVFDVLQPGLQFAGNIADGSYGNAASILSNTLQPLASKHPELQQALSFLQPAGQFAQGIASGNGLSAFANLSSSVGNLVENPQLKRGLQWAGDFGNVANSLAQHRNPAEALQLFANSAPVQELLQGARNGSLGQGIQQFSSNVAQITGNPVLQQGMQWISQSGQFVQDLQSGNVSQALAHVQKLPIQWDEQQQHHLQLFAEQTQNMETWVRSLVQGDVQNAIGSLNETQSPLFKQPKNRDFMEQLSAQQQWFSGLHSNEAPQYWNELSTGFQSLSQPQPLESMISSLVSSLQFLLAPKE